MPNAQVEGDANTGGGIVVSAAQGTVYAHNQKVAVDGSAVSGHGKGIHSSPVTAGGSPNVFIENTPVNRLGDSDTCGHVRVGRSTTVFINDGS